jgi:hypothetical protein
LNAAEAARRRRGQREPGGPRPAGGLTGRCHPPRRAALRVSERGQGGRGQAGEPGRPGPSAASCRRAPADPAAASAVQAHAHNASSPFPPTEKGYCVRTADRRGGGRAHLPSAVLRDGTGRNNTMPLFCSALGEQGRGFVLSNLGVEASRLQPNRACCRGIRPSGDLPPGPGSSALPARSVALRPSQSWPQSG